MAALRRLLFLLLLLILSLSKQTFSQSQSEALLKLKTYFANSTALDSWVPNSDACVNKWIGVMCLNGAITGLLLQDMALSGIINVEALREALREVPSLRAINFRNNSFSGPIPEFTGLGNLRSLYLSANQFSGEIRSEYFSHMTSLRRVWLDKNQFTGKIPDSVMFLPNLVELHLEGNQFSGPIPPLKQPTTVTSLDLSHNKLEGELPESFASFSANAFAGNDGICGKPLSKPCNVNPPPPPPSPPPAAPAPPTIEQAKPSGGGVIKMLLIAAAVIFCVIVFLLLAFLYRRRKVRDHFSVLESEHLNNEAEVHHDPESNNRRPRESTRKSKLIRKASGQNRSAIADVVMVCNERGSFTLSDLMKAEAEVLGHSGLGSTYKAALANNGLTVVVKRMREMNVIGRDTFDAEMRRLGSLRHPNILAPLAYHFRKEEKLMVSEYMPKGSLLYLLHGDSGVAHEALNWPTRLKIIKGIAHGMGFIHSEFASYELPHGNLKSSNVILKENFEPLLTDYAFHPLLNPNHATQTLFAYKTPEYVEYQQVSPKSDVYCLGIIILEILTGQLSSQYLANGKGRSDVLDWVRSAISRDKEAELIDPNLTNVNGDSHAMMTRLLRVGAACTESNPEQRPDVGEAIRKIEEIQN